VMGTGSLPWSWIADFNILPYKGPDLSIMVPARLVGNPMLRRSIRTKHRTSLFLTSSRGIPAFAERRPLSFASKAEPESVGWERCALRYRACAVCICAPPKRLGVLCHSRHIAGWFVSASLPVKLHRMSLVALSMWPV
jgi:hypothetical protein